MAEIWTTFEKPLDYKHHGKYGTNNKCLSSLNLTLTPQAQIRLFLIFRLYLSSQGASMADIWTASWKQLG